MHIKRRAAFSLVELSIVLVILGLLIGGILAGKSLIRASELRAVGTEYQRYITAVHSFRDRYFAFPGDMSTATMIWGKDNAACTGHTGTAATPGTCNGNGNNAINNPGGANATGEIFRFWQHMQLAGLVEGTLSGNSGPSGATDTIGGTNAPASKLNNGIWGIYYTPNYGGDSATYSFDYGNMLLFGARISGTIAYNPALTPEEAWNIDTKLDDGKPGRGKIMAMNWAPCTLSTSNTDYDKGYRLDSTAVACAFYFPQAF